MSAPAAPVSSELQAFAIDSCQSRQPRPEACSCANRLGTRWWQWSGGSLRASHGANRPESVATY